MNAKRLRIGVVGDIVEDLYFYGKVSRISPEFPVPILKSSTGTPDKFPGGSANVALQLKHFNVETFLFGFVDNDCLEMLVHHPINLDGCVRMGGRNPRKIRFYDGDYPMLRWDIEQPNYGLASTLPLRENLIRDFEETAEDAGFDIVILSNYDKGVFDEEVAKKIIAICNRLSIPTLVDPKSNIKWWSGCTVFKPNSSEAKAFCPGSNHWLDLATCIKNEINCRSVVITLSGDGVAGVSDELFEYKPKVYEKNVQSVIGAGDCFAALLAFGLGHKLSVKDACGIAFEGGVQYVKEKHNRPITWYELHRRLNPVKAKIVKLHDLLYIKNHILTGNKIVLSYETTSESLNCAKSFGNKLVVAVSEKKKKSMESLASLECVDFVTSYEEKPDNIIFSLSPDIIVGDYVPKDYQGQVVKC